MDLIWSWHSSQDCIGTMTITSQYDLSCAFLGSLGHTFYNLGKTTKNCKFLFSKPVPTVTGLDLVPNGIPWLKVLCPSPLAPVAVSSGIWLCVHLSTEKMQVPSLFYFHGIAGFRIRKLSFSLSQRKLKGLPCFKYFSSKFLIID